MHSFERVISELFEFFSTFQSGSVFSAASVISQATCLHDLVINLFCISAWSSDVRTQHACNVTQECL